MSDLGKPVDRKKWGMNPQTVNAYNGGLENKIVFPAGILQAPFFDPNADDAVNYGAIGAVIGHEITHGFDDQGRKIDATGAVRDWWSESDGKRFEERAKVLGAQYAAYEAVPGAFVNPDLTMGENIADNAGLQIAEMHRDEPQPGPKGDRLALSQGLRFGRYLELGDDTGLLLTIGSKDAPSPKGIEGAGGMRANNVNDGEDDLSRRPYDVVIYSEDAAFKGMERLMLPWTRVYAESTEEQALEDVARVIVLEGGKLETVAAERFSDEGYDADLDGEFIDPLFEACTTPSPTIRTSSTSP